MKITKVVVGLLEENCYVLEKDKQVIVVDPGDEYERIKSIWKNFLQKVKAVWDFGQKKFAGKSSTEKYMIAGGCVALVILIFSLIVLLIRRRR